MRSEQEGTGAGAEGEDEPIVANYHREGLLDDRDLLDFIEKHLVTREGHPEYYLTLMQDMFSDPTLPISNTIFVENAVTGTFSALSTGPSHATREKAVSKGMKDENKLLENVPKGSGDGSNDYPELGKKALLVPPFPMRISVSEADEMQARKTDEWTLVTMEYRNFAFMRRLGFLIFQGLVGGFAVVTLYVRTSSTGGDVGFLETYAPISNELRRYFFLLTTLSVTGSFDLVISTISTATAKSSLLDHLSLAPAQAPRWLHGQRMRLFLSFVVAVLHLLAFLATLVMSRVDVLAHQNALLQEVDGVEVLQGTNKDRVDEWVSLRAVVVDGDCTLHSIMAYLALIGLQRAKGALTLKEATDILVVHR
eukprot:scaffold247_cov172-Ochromonas_danica.AAC.12